MQNIMQSASLTNFLTNISDQLPDITLLVTGSAYVIGSTFGVIALMKAGKHAKAPEQVPFAQVIAPFLVCVLLIWLPTFIGSLALTTFGTLTPTPISYVSSQSGMSKAAFVGLLGLVKLFGLIAVIRGVIILKGVGEGKEGGDAVSRAIFHMIGGIALYYIEGTAKIVSNLFIQ